VDGLAQILQGVILGWSNSSKAQENTPSAKDRLKFLSLGQAMALKHQLRSSKIMLELVKFADSQGVTCS